MRHSEIACNPCQAADAAFSDLVISVTGKGYLVLLSADQGVICDHTHDSKALSCLQADTEVIMPSMNAKLESAMTSPHWKRLFVST